MASALPASLATSAFFLSLRDDDAFRARAHRFLTSSRSLHNSEGHGRASKPDGGAKLSKRAFEALARCRHCLSRSRASFVTVAKTPPLRSDAASFAAWDESAAWSANEGAPRALQAILSSLALRASRHVATTKISGSRRHGTASSARAHLTPWARGLRSKPARRARAAAAAAAAAATASEPVARGWCVFAGPFWLSRASAARRCGGGGPGPCYFAQRRCRASHQRYVPHELRPPLACCKCWPGCRLSYCCSRALHCASARSRYARETGVASRSVSPQMAIDARS